MDCGPGYRVYFGMAGKQVVVLLAGGDKDSQPADIARRQVLGRFQAPATEDLMKTPKAAVSHRKRLITELRADPEPAREYLTAAIEDPDPQVLLAALHAVVEARGMARVAKAAGIPRESLYRALSPQGNPRLDTLLAVIHAAGFRIAFVAPGKQAA